MGYDAALGKAWDDLRSASGERRFKVRFLADNYDIDTEHATVLSETCNAPAKDYAALLILHYSIKRLQLKEIPQPVGEWIDFSRLEGGESYYPVFKKRTIETLVKKFGSDLALFTERAVRLGAKRADKGDAGILIEPFDCIPILMAVWRADEEFGPGADILFDKDISKIFPTEDIVVLTEIIVHQL